MILRTFGGLRLEGAELQRPMLLFLLAYLAIEGPQEKRHVAELFWLGTKNPMSNLAMALSRLRKHVPGIVQSDGIRIWTSVETDAQKLLAALEADRLEQVEAIYRAPFLEGFYQRALRSELEDWMYGTREFLAHRVREALVKAAEGSAAGGRFQEAARKAEQALTMIGAGAPEPELLERLFACLIAGDSLQATTVQKDAESFGLILTQSREAARKRLTAGAERVPIPNNLPAAKTSFVGREHELREIAYCFSQGVVRLLTLHGIGGVGKSRLAVQAAKAQLERGSFQHGIFLVTLDSLPSADLIPIAIAQALHLELTGLNDTLSLIMESIGEQRFLLVLDNYEHLMDGATLPSELLRECPNLKILVTSREILNVDEEWVMMLEGLRYPANTEIELDEARTFDAVNLFLQRANQAQLGYAPTSLELPHLIELCQLVEGAPLALELAAVWIRLLKLESILEEVKENLTFLRSQSRSPNIRHESIEAVFEHSWRLLTPKEQAVMRRLSVFVGGFDRQSASEVAGATLAILVSLVNKALLQSVPSGRFGKHFLIHECTTGKLRNSPDEWTRTKSRFTRFYCALLSSRSEAIMGPEQDAVLEHFDHEIENIVAAWQDFFTLDQEDQLPSAIITFTDYLFIKGRGKEAIDHLSAALELSEDRESPNDLVLATVLQCLAWLHSDVGDAVKAHGFAERSLGLLDGTRHAQQLAWSLRILGNLCRRRGEFEQAESLMQREIGIYQAESNQKALAPALNNLGLLYMVMGRYVEAEERLLEGITLDRLHESLSGLVNDLHSLGELYLLTKSAGRASDAFQESLNIAKRLNYVTEIPFSLAGLGKASQQQGEHKQARKYLQEALAYASLTKNDRALISILTSLAAFKLETNELTRVEEYLARALKLARSYGKPSDVIAALVEAARLYQKLDRCREAAQVTNFIASSPASWRVMLEDAEHIREACVEKLEGSITRSRARMATQSPLDQQILEILDGLPRALTE